MSFRTDPQRTAIARELLAAMLQGACSATINLRHADEFTKRLLVAPEMAVRLTDILIAELDKAERVPPNTTYWTGTAAADRKYDLSSIH